MNWKLIFQLSLFGLFMGIATVYFIPSKVEPVCWIAIFIICAITIANKAGGMFFLHGFCVSLFNAVWITSAHIILYDTYIASHTEEARMLTKMPLPDSPRLMMLITGPIIGIISGLVLGLFAFIASKIVKKNPIK
jgi:hypothetical protein